MALIQCPECGKSISDAAEACPNCGYPIAEVRKQEAEREKTPQAKEDSKQKNAGRTVIAIAVCCVILFAIFYLARGGITMNRSDKAAYNAVVYASERMIDPVSVRLVGGRVVNMGSDKVTYCEISANNAYGTRITCLYTITEKNGKYSLEEDKVGLSGFHDNKTLLNIEAINKRLAKRFAATG